MSSHAPHLTDAMRLALARAANTRLDPWDFGSSTIGALKRCGFIVRDPESPKRALYVATDSGRAALIEVGL